MSAFDPGADYPLSSRRPDLARTRSGLSLDELTLDALRAGRLEPGDVRSTPEILRRQADVARATGRAQLADNLARAAELTAVPDDVVLAVYSALRPRRSTAGELEAWAQRLEREFRAPSAAAFVREALAAYESRGLLAPAARSEAP